MEGHVTEEFMSSLEGLRNSSALRIKVLTTLSEEHIEFADRVVSAVVKHLDKCPPSAQLPCLHLIDSIIKNVGKDYVTLFSRCIIPLFASMFLKASTPTRQGMYKLRLTWNTLFSFDLLSTLDSRIRLLDPFWPTAVSSNPGMQTKPFVKQVYSSTNAQKWRRNHASPHADDLTDTYKQKRSYSGYNEEYFKKFKSTVSGFAQTPKPEPVLNVPREQHAIRHFGEQRNLQNCPECFGCPSFRPFKPAFDSHSTRLEFRHCSKIGSSLPPLPYFHGSSPLASMRHLHPPSMLPSFMYTTASAPTKQEAPGIPVFPIAVPFGSPGFPLPTASDDLKSNVVSTKLPMSSNAAPSRNLAVNFRLSKLLAAGVIHSSISKEPEVKVEVKSIKNEKVKERNQEFDRKETKGSILHAGLELQNLMVRRPEIINFLYQGTQCASCDKRFKESDKEKYRSHLDWHFRMNRKTKNTINERSVKPWHNHYENWGHLVMNGEPKEPVSNFFELQAVERLQAKPVIEVPSVPASSQENESCAVCKETFRQFWVDDEEEWHLQNAVHHNNVAFHPACYE